METEEAKKELTERAGVKKQTWRNILEDFLEKQPIFYDRNSLFWIWRSEKFCWELCDEVDILNSFYKVTKRDTLKSKVRAGFVSGIKQVSRLKKPKKPKSCWLQFKDSIIDIKTGEEFKASPEYFLTSPIPFSLGEKSDTPEMDKLFTSWVGEEYRNKLYQVIAYASTKEQFLQVIIALTGAGSNGKGTFQSLLRKFLGRENCVSSNFKSLINRSFETSALYQKLFCVIGEVDTSDLSNTNVLKQMTGEDLIRYEFKGKTPFSEDSPTTFVVATNSLPITPDKSIGFYRRWEIIDFPNEFKVKRNLLSQIPEEEYNNLCRKVVNLLKNLYEVGEMDLSGTFEEKRQRYEARSNPLMIYISKNFNEVGEGFLNLRKFSNEFNEYLKENRLRIMTVTRLGKLLRDEGFETGSRKYRNKLGVVIGSAKSVIGLEPKTTQTTEKPYTAKCFRCQKEIKKDENLKLKEDYFCVDCFKIMEKVK